MALLQESERHRAERAARRVVDGAVDGVERPGPRGPGRARAGALLLAEETDARRGLGQQVPDGVLDGEIDVGDRVPIALGGHRGGAPGPDHLGGDAGGPAPDGQQSRNGCLGVPAHAASLPRRCAYVRRERITLCQHAPYLIRRLRGASGG